MNKGKKGNVFLKCIVILFCLLILAAMAWAFMRGSAKLLQYNTQTTIEQDDREEQEENPSVEDQSSVDVEDTISKNLYLPDAFSHLNGLKTYQDEATSGIIGIDVSSFQQEIDWNTVKDAGVEFAMIRVGFRGYKSSKLQLDEYFLRNMEGALNAGIKVGVYFFSQALDDEEAVEEAEFVLNWIQGYDIQMPVAFDWEEVDTEARTDDMNMLALTSCANAFCQKIEENGYTASVYFNQTYGYQQFNLQSLSDYDFWLAEYADVPSFYYHFHMWQYTNEGTVPGIQGPVDLNIAFQPS